LCTHVKTGLRTPIRAGRVICEVGGKVYWEEVRPWLKRFAKLLPFEAIAVNTEILSKLDEEEEKLKDTNVNPVTPHLPPPPPFRESGNIVAPVK
jgi:hypothetical protein